VSRHVAGEEVPGAAAAGVAGGAGSPGARTGRHGGGAGPGAPAASGGAAALAASIAALVATALAEDIGSGDVTTEAIVPADARAQALVTQKAPGVIFGLEAAEAVFVALDPQARCERLVEEGVWREQGGSVLSVEATARALLTGERSALNLLGHLSGVATLAARAARAVEGTGAKVVDTRKTTPGMRLLEKAAVRAGGAGNHRTGLYDAILIKNNHIAAAGGVARAVALAREHSPQLAESLEVEVRNPREIEEALAAGAGRLLLDNMDDEEMRAAVAQVDGRALLEASGGVGLERLPELARTGIDWISMGALTHSAPALDVSMSLETLP
jgi:nicotinate-nucleotide pyrophosphorylase (carboxylating)